jgi:hypothetical protein
VLNAPDGDLYRFDRFLNLTFQVATGTRIAASGTCWMQQCGQDLLIYHPETGLLMLDEYGTVLRRFPQKGLSSPGFDAGYFYGLHGKEVVLYDTKAFLTHYATSAPGAKAVYIWKGHAYWLHEKHVSVEQFVMRGG